MYLAFLASNFILSDKNAHFFGVFSLKCIKKRTSLAFLALNLIKNVGNECFFN